MSNIYTYEFNSTTGYETLLQPDGTEVAMITEPEDRNFARDLGPIIDELNRLAAELRELHKDMRVIHKMAQNVTKHCYQGERLHCSGCATSIGVIEEVSGVALQQMARIKGESNE